MTDSLTIRTARPTDAEALARLAELDSSNVPAGQLLIAEAAGQMLAAVSVENGHAIADPFMPTAHTVGVLHTRAAQLRAPERPARFARRRLRLHAASG